MGQEKGGEPLDSAQWKVAKSDRGEGALAGLAALLLDPPFTFFVHGGRLAFYP